MTRDLPTDVEKALDAIAGGWGREPGFAHPDCICIAEAERFYADQFYKRQPCPMHPKARR